MHDRELETVERWFVERGIPHFVESRVDGSILDSWTRALPLLVAAYPLLALNALDLRDWSAFENALVGVLAVLAAIATWALSNRLRRQPTFGRPTDIDAPELALFVLGPALPVALLGQFADALQSVAFALALLALIYGWTAYGIGPLLRWAARQSLRQVGALAPLLARALPLLLGFNTFLFINAEVWEVAGTLDGASYAIVLATFLTLGVMFAATRVSRFVASLNHFESWAEVAAACRGTPAEDIACAVAADISAPTAPTAPAADPLGRRQRFNIGLIALFTQVLQVALVITGLTAFFLGFGFLAIGEAVAANWTGGDVAVLFTFTLDGRNLVISEPLVRVATFLGAFSGMYFIVLLATDSTYREEFDDESSPAIRQALAARSAYRMVRGTHPDAAARRG